jgi:sugar phosphate isomerase/epimerase
MRKIGFLAGLDFGLLDPESVAQILASEGYQAVSWPLAWFDPQRKSDEDRQRLVSASQRAGLQISEWVLQLDYVTLNEDVWSDRVSHSEQAIKAISQLGLDAPINVFSGPAPWDPTAPKLFKEIPAGTAWELVKKAFDRILKVAETEKVTLAIEPVFGHVVHDYFSLLELLRSFASPSLRVNFDPSHGILYQNDTGWVIRQLGERIVHCHLKDAVGKPGGLPGDTFQFPLLGEGEVPWQDFITALNDIRYTGVLTVEFESFRYYQQVLQSNPRLAARQAMHDLKRIGLDK